MSSLLTVLKMSSVISEECVREYEPVGKVLGFRSAKIMDIKQWVYRNKKRNEYSSFILHAYLIAGYYLLLHIL